MAFKWHNLLKWKNYKPQILILQTGLNTLNELVEKFKKKKKYKSIFPLIYPNLFS